ncbi:Ammonium transporter [hydrothermal vent metagenome]|uniref:Ammonium transporter n=1 Tax=hydrothermal vent metagenome TaxID=652676 RepID=A0A3B0W8E3_9ZZZZ
MFLLAFPALAEASNDAGSNIIIDAQALLLVVGAALVFFMQAGFALLESGFVRSKNAVNVIMKNYTDMAFGMIIYWAFGYALMFGTNTTGLIGMSEFMPDLESNSDLLGLLYQMMFAATAATIISGAVAERMRFWAYIFTSVFVTGLIYPIFGSWAWGGNETTGFGWLNGLGFIDFAGSTVVHSIGGWCALAAVIVLKPRLGRFGSNNSVRDIPGHNLTMVALGGFILWFGWFGFNGASITSSEQSLGLILINTQLAAAAGVVAVIAIMAISRKPILISQAVNGSLAGLVAITAGAATMSPGFALLTGLIAGVVVILFNNLLLRMGIDDVVGAVGVHGASGAWGTLAAGIFYQGDLFNMSRIAVQFFGVVAAFVWAFGVGFIVYKAIDMMIGIRAPSLHEQHGLDYTEHAELGYPEFQKNLTHSGEV